MPRKRLRFGGALCWQHFENSGLINIECDEMIRLKVCCRDSGFEMRNINLLLSLVGVNLNHVSKNQNE